MHKILLAAMLEDQRGPLTWRLHTRLCNFVQNISTNISALRRRTHLKLGELSSLFIVYNITIFWLYLLHGFWFYFLLRDSAHTLYYVLVHCGWYNIIIFSSSHCTILILQCRGILSFTCNFSINTKWSLFLFQVKPLAV